VRHVDFGELGVMMELAWHYTSRGVSSTLYVSAVQ
jgi:hypothetical protein